MYTLTKSEVNTLRKHCENHILGDPLPSIQIFTMGNAMTDPPSSLSDVPESYAHLVHDNFSLLDELVRDFCQSHIQSHFKLFG